VAVRRFVNYVLGDKFMDEIPVDMRGV